MIAQNTPYHVGTRALVFMVFRKLKYPLLLALIMIAISFAMSAGSQSVSAWAAGTSGFFRSLAAFLYGLQKYGWVLTIFLAVFFAAIAVLEYQGLTFKLDDKALYVRSGLLTHNEIAIPYRQIQTINIVERASTQMFGLCSVVVVTSATVKKGDNDESEATFPLMRKTIAQELRSELIGASGNAS